MVSKLVKMDDVARMLDMETSFIDVMVDHNKDMIVCSGFDASEFDTTLTGSIVHNFYPYLGEMSEETPEQDYAFGVNFAHQVTSAAAPDAFFAWASERILGKPAVLIFISLDDTILGRCFSIQTVGGIIAITLVDKRFQRFPALTLAEAPLKRYNRVVCTLQSIRDTSCSTTESTILDESINDSATLVAKQIREVLGEEYPDACELQWPGAHQTMREAGRMPDLAKLLSTNVRGPVEMVKNAANVAIAKVMGGKLAIVFETDPDHATDLPALQTAEIIFCFKATAIDDDPVRTWVRDDTAAGHVRIIAVVQGIPPSHVIHVIEDAAYAANVLLYEFTTHNVDKLVHILTSACDASAHDRALSARVRTRRLSHALARTLDANLEAIKAHLWRPDGRLVAAMIGCDE